MRGGVLVQMRSAAVAFVLGLLSMPGSAQNAPLFVIPTEQSPDAPTGGGQALRVALYARELAKLAKVLGQSGPGPEVDHLVYVFDAYPELSVAAGRTWLEPTFVVDFEEPEVGQLTRMLASAGRDRPSGRQLAKFVAETMQQSLSRGWDVASMVARNRQGDCSEFAVLTAALARAAKIPSRIVLGLAVVHEEHGYQAYGHVWAEVQEGDRWRIIDAALNGVARRVEYLPLGILTDEGPGFTLDLMRITSVWIQRIVVLGGESSRDRSGRE